MALRTPDSPRVKRTSAALILAALVGVVGELPAAAVNRSEDAPYFEPFPPADYKPYRALRKHPGPLIGTNYTHTAFPHCSWNGTAILATYHDPGVRLQVHKQLAAMRAHGIDSLRTIIWHMTDPGPHAWGPIPSAGGQLTEPYRTNLAEFAAEVRRYGYRRLTVSMGPTWTNNPLTFDYDPATFEENWQFLRAVRYVVKRYGPVDTRIDILNEGAPSDYLDHALIAQINAYDFQMWRRYVKSYGRGDAVVSAIAPENRYDRGSRLTNLIATLRSTGVGLPRWFELHANRPAGDVMSGLRSVDGALAAANLAQPITIGETSYNDQQVAQALSAFVRTSKHKLTEVVEWFAKPEARCNVSPPYRADAYTASLGR